VKGYEKKKYRARENKEFPPNSKDAEGKEKSAEEGEIRDQLCEAIVREREKGSGTMRRCGFEGEDRADRKGKKAKLDKGLFKGRGGKKSDLNHWKGTGTKRGRHRKENLPSKGDSGRTRGGGPV